MTDSEADRPAPRAWSAVDSPRGSRTILAFGLCGAITWWMWLGAGRWFHADDWSYLLPRNLAEGAGSVVLHPHNGHPVVLPALQFSVTSALFGWSSYLPYLAAAVALHVLCGLLLWRLIRLIGVSELSAVLVTLATLLIGAATEFPTFAAISSYQYSLISLLVSMIVVYRYDDHSPMLLVASAVGFGAALSSSFVVVFAIAVALATFGQRRWRAGAIVLGPQTALYAWWWFSWGRDRGASRGTMSEAPEWAVRVLQRSFEGLAGPGMGVLALVATALFGVAFCPPGPARRSVVWPMAVAAAVGALLVGAERSDLGTADVATGRYVVVFAFLLAPAVAIAVDSSRRVGRPAFAVVVTFLIVAAGVNSLSWRVDQLAVADATQLDRRALALLAGSDLSGVPDDHRPSWCSVAIRIVDLPRLVDHGAITPQSPTSDEEERLVAASVGALPDGEPDPRPCDPPG